MALTAVLEKRSRAQKPATKKVAHPARAARQLVKWTEIVGGLVVLALLAVGAAFVVSTFVLATVGVGQLELRILILLGDWWVSGPLLAAVVVAVVRHRYRLWKRLRAGSTGSNIM